MSVSERHPDLLAAARDAGATDALLALAGELTLLVDRDGLVVEARGGGDAWTAALESWIGKPWDATVTIESKPKLVQLLAGASAGEAPRWRQVTHILPTGEVPVRYACIPADGRTLAIGRDMRDAAAMQQRLLQAQQSLERDYLRLRQAEGRYRLLFDLPDEATLIVDTATWRIAEANAAAHRLLGLAAGTLAGQPVSSLAEPASREALLARLGAAAAGADMGGVVTLRTGATMALTGAPFRQDRSVFLLLRLNSKTSAPTREADGGLQRVVDAMPDAFVLTGRSLAVVAANTAFFDLVAAPAGGSVLGQPIGTWLGRPGIDVEIILAELRKSGVVRNVVTILRGSDGGQDEIELSAVRVEGAGEEHYGFVLRTVARRLRDLPPVERDLPRSVEQLTELVGRVSLKQIVRESTDLIERLCIEAALDYTADNRASAAELLGLSRQGFYTKLHRHGLGNLVSEE